MRRSQLHIDQTFVDTLLSFLAFLRISGFFTSKSPDLPTRFVLKCLRFSVGLSFLQRGFEVLLILTLIGRKLLIIGLIYQY